MISEIFLKRKKADLYLFLILIIFFFTLLNLSNYSDKFVVQAHNNLNWLSYEQALTRSRVEDIPAIIYFYSDDCGWCRKMEQETFATKEVQDLLNKNFTMAKINGKSNEQVLIGGEKKTEKWLSTAIYQVTGFPSIWFLNSGNGRIANLPGFVPPDVFLDVLIYIKDGFYKEHTFPQYMELQKK
ncbi:MAG: thioredoxin fold domain-containing protein [Atribacterota bacterium]|nr:thioredoxin fold domain-containing protein [Atribacterota bacterium]MDD4895938.1 thioredoxin fold domain-containing protein [Atribacterota bacterium]MDD5637391.1 thioredoxin fold domain-containing protein [Atribacterota bacterium]